MSDFDFSSISIDLSTLDLDVNTQVSASTLDEYSVQDKASYVVFNLLSSVYATEDKQDIINTMRIVNQATNLSLIKDCISLTRHLAEDGYNQDLLDEEDKETGEKNKTLIGFSDQDKLDKFRTSLTPLSSTTIFAKFFSCIFDSGLASLISFKDDDVFFDGSPWLKLERFKHIIKFMDLNPVSSMSVKWDGGSPVLSVPPINHTEFNVSCTLTKLDIVFKDIFSRFNLESPKTNRPNKVHSGKVMVFAPYKPVDKTINTDLVDGKGSKSFKINSFARGYDVSAPSFVDYFFVTLKSLVSSAIIPPGCGGLLEQGSYSMFGILLLDSMAKKKRDFHLVSQMGQSYPPYKVFIEKVASLFKSPGYLSFVDEDLNTLRECQVPGSTGRTAVERFISNHAAVDLLKQIVVYNWVCSTMAVNLEKKCKFHEGFVIDLNSLLRSQASEFIISKTRGVVKSFFGNIISVVDNSSYGNRRFSPYLSQGKFQRYIHLRRTLGEIPSCSLIFLNAKKYTEEALINIKIAYPNVLIYDTGFLKTSANYFNSTNIRTVVSDKLKSLDSSASPMNFFFDGRFPTTPGSDSSVKTVILGLIDSNLGGFNKVGSIFTMGSTTSTLPIGVDHVMFREEVVPSISSPTYTTVKSDYDNKIGDDVRFMYEAINYLLRGNMLLIKSDIGYEGSAAVLRRRPVELSLQLIQHLNGDDTIYASSLKEHMIKCQTRVSSLFDDHSPLFMTYFSRILNGSTTTEEVSHIDIMVEDTLDKLQGKNQDDLSTDLSSSESDIDSGLDATTSQYSNQQVDSVPVPNIFGTPSGVTGDVNVSVTSPSSSGFSNKRSLDDADSSQQKKQKRN